MAVLGRSQPFRPHLAKAVLSGLVLLPSAVVVHAQPTPGQYRNAPPKPHLAPVNLSGPPITQRGVIRLQAVKGRTLIGRTTPAPHLPPSIIGQQPVNVRALVRSQAVKRALVGRSTPRPHLPHLAPSGPPLPRGLFNFSWQAKQWHRNPQRPLLAPPIVPPTKAIQPPAIVISQASKRSYLRPRAAQKPILPKLGSPAQSPRGIFRLNAVKRSFQRPRLQRPNLGSLGLQPPRPTGLVKSQAVKRALIGRSTPRPHLAAGLLGPPFPNEAAYVVSAVGRSFLRPLPQRPHLARVPLYGPVFDATNNGAGIQSVSYLDNATFAAPPYVGPSAYLVSQARQRALIGRQVPPPILPTIGKAAQPPVPRGVVRGQAVRAAFLGRTVPRPHLAPAIPGKAPLPFGLFKSQAVARSLIGRFPPRPHVAPPVLTKPAPVPFGLVVLQARQRPYVGRTTPPPHLPKLGSAPPLKPAYIVSGVQRSFLRPLPQRPHIAPIPPTALPRLAFVKNQALQRALIGRFPPTKPITGKLGVQPPANPGLVVSPAAKRALVGRSTPRPHLPAVITGSPPFAPAIVKSQALQHPPRGVPKPHLAPPVTTQPHPLSPGRFISQAIQRALVGRTTPRPHLAPPPPPSPVHLGLIVSQSLRRTYVGRTTPAPHLGKLGPPQPFPGANLRLQALKRAPRYRTAPIPHLPNLGQPPLVSRGVVRGGAVKFRSLIGRFPPTKPILGKLGARPPASSWPHHQPGRPTVLPGTATVPAAPPEADFHHRRRQALARHRVARSPWCALVTEGQVRHRQPAGKEGVGLGMTLPITNSFADSSHCNAIDVGNPADSVTLGPSYLPRAENLTNVTWNVSSCYANADTTWANWQDPYVCNTGYGFTEWLNASPTTRQIIVDVRLVSGYVCNPGSAGYDANFWQTGSTGAYNTYAVGLATKFVNAGWGNCVLRLSAEMNGNWNFDSIGIYGSAQWATYGGYMAGCWQQMVGAMKGVAGFNMLICWNPNSNYQPIPFADYYPGNAYVDIIGIDQYNSSGQAGIPTVGQPNRMSALWAQPYGVNALYSFAQSNSKPFAIPEWGCYSLGSGQTNTGGDEAAYVTYLLNWCASNNVAFQCYYDPGDANVLQLDPNSPNGASYDGPLSLAAYSAFFSVQNPPTITSATIIS